MPYKDTTSPAAIDSLRAARRKHYHANKDAYIARAREAKRRTREMVRQLKSGPCVDCGIAYPYYVMQFDHVSDDKLHNISRLMTSGSNRKLLAEIAKCELVCSNCHAVRTHVRGSEQI
jgi:5-methylcytosine-specific restriction endonuclease McrA